MTHGDREQPDIRQMQNQTWPLNA